MKEKVILIDENDKQIGSCEKMKAHAEGKLHRAFSIFIFNPEGKLLLQKRAKGKYHSGGLWTNTCCGHPRPGEETLDAAHRRLQEEMGFNCPLKEVFSFCYSAQLEDGLSENEYDHVFFGSFDGNPDPDPSEAEDWRWANLSEVGEDIKANPDQYTHWFKIALERVIKSRRIS